MCKIKDYMLEHPMERISASDAPKENPFKSDMTHEELVEDREGNYEGSPIGGWDR